MNKFDEVKKHVKKHGFITIRNISVNYQLNSPHDTVRWLKTQFKTLKAVKVRNPRTKSWFKIWYRPCGVSAVQTYIAENNLEKI